jgi:hypothetical protein
MMLLHQVIAIYGQAYSLEGPFFHLEKFNTKELYHIRTKAALLLSAMFSRRFSGHPKISTHN